MRNYYISEIPAIARLNKSKHSLEGRSDQTWQQWLLLSTSYKEFNFIANAHYCFLQAQKLGYDPDKETDVKISQ